VIDRQSVRETERDIEENEKVIDRQSLRQTERKREKKKEEERGKEERHREKERERHIQRKRERESIQRERERDREREREKLYPDWNQIIWPKSKNCRLIAHEWWLVLSLPMSGRSFGKRINDDHGSALW
jgi:hypothetical protein